MKIHEIIKEDFDDDSRDMKNPIRNVSGEDYFDQWDEITGAFIDKFSDELKPLFTADREAWRNRYKELIDKLRDMVSTKVDIPISDLTGSESHLDGKHLQAIIGGKSKKGLPVVLKTGDVNFIIDGNHRVAAAHQSGKKTVPVNLIDFDKAIKIATNFKR